MFFRHFRDFCKMDSKATASVAVRRAARIMRLSKLPMEFQLWGAILSRVDATRRRSFTQFA